MRDWRVFSWLPWFVASVLVISPVAYGQHGGGHSGGGHQGGFGGRSGSLGSHGGFGFGGYYYPTYRGYPRHYHGGPGIYAPYGHGYGGDLGYYPHGRYYPAYPAFSGGCH